MRALWLLSLVAVLCGLSRGAWGQQSHAATDPSPPNPRSVQYDPDDDYYDDGDDEPGQPALPPGNVYPSPYDDDPGYDYQKDMARSRKREVEGDLSKILGDDDYDYCRDLEYRVRSGEYHLCKLKEAAKARCPGFAAACDKPPIEDKGSLLGGEGPSAPRGAAKRSRTSRRRRRRRPACPAE